MIEYEYSNPLNNGYVKTNISKKQLNSVFKYKKGIGCKPVVFYNREKDTFLIEYLTPVWMKVLGSLTYPISVLVHGLSNYKEVWDDCFKYSWYERKYGKFTSDTIYVRQSFMHEQLRRFLK